MASNDFDVFISYSSKNQKIADALLAYLEQQRIRCWMAPRNILPGQEYAEAIDEALFQIKVFVLVFSAQSVQSQWVKKETNLAVSDDKVIIPFKIDDTRLAGSGFRLYLNDRHWIEAASAPETHFQEAAEAIRQQIGEPEPDEDHTSEAPDKKKASAVPTLNELLASPGKVPELQKLARQGNAEAQYLLGWLYDTGVHVRRDYSQGYAWFYQAVQQGHLLAKFFLARDLYNGTGVKQDKKLAKEIFADIEPQLSDGARRGEATCQFACGVLAERGILGERDPQTAFRYYSLAAEQNEPNAMTMLYHCFYDGIGTAKNLPKAFELAQRMVKMGIPSGYIALAYYYMAQATEKKPEEAKPDWENANYYLRRGLEAGMYENAALMGLAYLRKGEPKLAETYVSPYWDQILRDAENGYADCQFIVGLSFMAGIKGDRDPEEAFKWFQKAAMNDCDNAQTWLARCYLNGSGTEADPEQGVHWLKECLKQSPNASDALLLLGQCYLLGNGVKQDEKNAVKLFRQAEPQDAEASLLLGLCAQNGLGMPQSDGEAQRYYEKAVKRNNTEAMCELGWFHINHALASGNPSLIQQNGQYAKALFEQAAQLNDAEGLLALGRCYLNGIGIETGPDPQTAEKYYRQAADRRNGEAVQALMNDLCICYSEKEQQLWQEMLRIVANAANSDSNLYAAGNIPEKKLRNAIAAYAQNVYPAQVLGLYDGTFFGKADTGFLIVTSGIAGKLSGAEPFGITWKDIQNITPRGNDIWINNNKIFDNYNSVFFAQMLQKLRDLYLGHFAQFYP